MSPFKINFIKVFSWGRGRRPNFLLAHGSLGNKGEMIRGSENLENFKLRAVAAAAGQTFIVQQGGLLRGASYGRRHGDIVKAAAEAAKSPAVGRPAPAAGAQTWHP